MDHSIGTFVSICFLLTITPGADTALILKSAMSSGRGAVVLTTLGICAGLLFHATMSSLGLSVVLQKSAELYTLIKMFGAGYLVYLGLRSLYDAFFGSNQETELKEIKSERRFGEFRTGLLTNILNPKVAVFYLTFLPQFVDVQRNVFFQSVGLAAIHIGMSFVWLCFIGYFVTYFKKQLTQSSFKKKIEAVTGLALSGFGLRLALSRD